MSVLHPDFKATLVVANEVISARRRAKKSTIVPFGEERFTAAEMRQKMEDDPRIAANMAKQTSAREVLDLIRKKER